MSDEEYWHCPKCGSPSGDDWSQCNKMCPIKMSPHYNEEIAEVFEFPHPYKTAGKIKLPCSFLKNPMQDYEDDIPF